MYTRNVHNNQQNSWPVHRPFIISRASHRDIYECKSNDIGESCTPPMGEREKGRQTFSFGLDPSFFFFFIEAAILSKLPYFCSALRRKKTCENERRRVKEGKETRREINNAIYLR